MINNWTNQIMRIAYHCLQNSSHIMGDVSGNFLASVTRVYENVRDMTMKFRKSQLKAGNTERVPQNIRVRRMGITH